MTERDSTRTEMLIGLVITAWLALEVALVAWQASKGSLVHHVIFGFAAIVIAVAVVGRIRALRRYWPARHG